MMIKNLGLSYQSFGINREALLANVKAWPSASTNFAIAMATTIGTLKRKEQNKFNTHLSEKLDQIICALFNAGPNALVKIRAEEHLSLSTFIKYAPECFSTRLMHSFAVLGAVDGEYRFPNLEVIFKKPIMGIDASDLRSLHCRGRATFENWHETLALRAVIEYTDVLRGPEAKDFENVAREVLRGMPQVARELAVLIRRPDFQQKLVTLVRDYRPG